MAPPRLRGTATAADIVDERQEVIRGELVPKDSATFEHAAAHGAIAAVLGPLAGRSRPARTGGWWLGMSVTIELETHEVFLPDLAGWRIDRVPEPPSGEPVRIMPDWVCEVLSPSTLGRDRGHKQRTYHRARIGHYWLVEPVDSAIWVYRWFPEGYTEVVSLEAEDVAAGELVRIEPFDAVGIDLADIFVR
jgi:Uma2 family endonuclease